MIDGFFSIVLAPEPMHGIWACVSMTDEDFGRLVDGDNMDLIRDRLAAVKESAMINANREVLATRIDGELVLMQRSFSFN